MTVTYCTARIRPTLVLGKRTCCEHKVVLFLRIIPCRRTSDEEFSASYCVVRLCNGSLVILAASHTRQKHLLFGVLWVVLLARIRRGSFKKTLLLLRHVLRLLQWLLRIIHDRIFSHLFVAAWGNTYIKWVVDNIGIVTASATLCHPIMVEWELSLAHFRTA